MSALAWVGVGWMGLVALLWLGLLVRALRGSRAEAYRIAPDDPACEPGERVSVLIPARDEEEDIGAAVAAVFAQDHAALDLVVIDDGSTDGTAAVLADLADHRLTVVDGGSDPLPPGWLGKPWACQRAARHATGDWLLFVDADVRLAPEAVSRAVAYADHHDLALLSGFGHVETVTLAERVMQPAVTGLIIAGNDLSEVNDPDRPDKVMANGQFLLFRRQAYLAIDGHEAVRHDVLDDVGLARAVKRAGLPYHLVFMRQLFSCRMYRSGPELWRGWRKNLFAGIHRSWAVLAVLVGGLLAVVVSPYLVVALAVVGVLEPAWLVWGGIPLLLIQGVRFYLDGVFGLDRWVGLLTHGLAQVLLVVLLIDSAVSTSLGTATWKGRRL